MTRTRLLLLLLAALAVLGLIAAVGGWFWLRRGPGDTPVAPPRGATARAVDPPLSSVVVPISIPMDALQQTLEASVPKVFVDERGRDLGHGFTLTAKISRAGEVEVTGRGGSLETTVPVDTRIEVQVPRQKRPLTVDGRLEVTARSALSLTDAWGLRSHTTLRSRWTEAPVLRVGQWELPIQSMLDPRIDAALLDAAARVDERLRERDPVRARLETAWTALHQPLPMRGDTPAWLQVQPDAILADAPSITASALSIQAGLRGRFSLVVGTQPEALDPTPLPDREAPEGAPTLSVQVPIALDWDALDRAIRPQLVGRAESLDVPGGAGTVLFTVTGAHFYPSGLSVVAALDYTLDGPSTPLDGRGRLYLSGVPVLSADRQELSLSDLQAAVETDSSAVDAVAWLAEAGALETLEERSRVPLTEKLEHARAQLEAGLSASEGRSAVLDGQIHSLRLADVIPTDDALVVTVIVEGEASLAVAELPPPRNAPPRPGKLEPRERKDREDRRSERKAGRDR